MYYWKHISCICTSLFHVYPNKTPISLIKKTINEVSQSHLFHRLSILIKYTMLTKFDFTVQPDSYNQVCFFMLCWNSLIGGGALTTIAGGSMRP